MHDRTVRVVVTGLVQGVGYRAWVEREARKLGLAGWVRNRRDGSVEAVFSGPAESVEAMISACAAGPRQAAVDNVEIGDAAAFPDSGFTVRPTE